ncbi:hypothetical protein PsorP6_013840 [Peronosclerospora sorghi]|uniref:Uncharacterized protein n=1 Tax=Peronosclerospora sorghi TaxID=230839 RepID=A0ACC0VHE5_9STRA|nr:hypothetical protein PsorP6_013840 [Peronosclerospora sorghi]
MREFCHLSFFLICFSCGLHKIVDTMYFERYNLSKVGPRQFCKRRSDVVVKRIGISSEDISRDGGPSVFFRTTITVHSTTGLSGYKTISIITAFEIPLELLPLW